MNRWDAIRSNHERGHVAMAVVPYRPTTGISAAVRARFDPWECCFHCDDGGPRRFVAFGGEKGIREAVDHFLGERLQPVRHASTPRPAMS